MAWALGVVGALMVLGGLMMLFRNLQAPGGLLIWGGLQLLGLGAIVEALYLLRKEVLRRLDWCVARLDPVPSTPPFPVVLAAPRPAPPSAPASVAPAAELPEIRPSDLPPPPHPPQRVSPRRRRS